MPVSLIEKYIYQLAIKIHNLHENVVPFLSPLKDILSDIISAVKRFQFVAELLAWPLK